VFLLRKLVVSGEEGTGVGGAAHNCRMAVQPDRRARELYLAEMGMDLVPVAESAPYVMCRFSGYPRPIALYLRDRRPNKRMRAGVWLSHTGRWSASPVGDQDLDGFATAEEAFAAWVALQDK